MTAVDDLRAALPDETVLPGDPAWDAARLFHSGIGEPTAVVRARSVDDVVAAVRWAAASATPICVRSGGHGPWGEVAGGLTIDLAALDDVEVDGALVRVGGGATWGRVARELAPRALGVSSGDTASVGVGGLTLGGGIGWMVRAWGLAADQLERVQLVTAGGEVIEADDHSHPDLMWALRGGGGNFGVVTRFDFRAHPLPAVVFGSFAVSEDTAPVLRALRDVMADAPRELTVTYMDVPPMDPNAPAGASVNACWAGDDLEAARAALAPLRAAVPLDEVEFGVRAYPDILLEMPGYDPAQPMPGFVGGNVLLRDLDDDVVDRIVSFRAEHPASVVLLRSLGGAFGDASAEATAFAARGATWFAMAGAFEVPGMLDDDERAAAVAEWAAIDQRGEGVYGNFSVTMDAGQVARMYPPATLSRLRAVKRVWDPANLFSRNHNVTPD